MKYLIVPILILSLSISACMNHAEKKDQAHQENGQEEIQQKENIPVRPHQSKAQAKPTISIDIKDDSTRQALMTQGRTIAAKTQRALQAELQSAVKSGGIEHAISYCNTRAMPLTDSMSKAYNVDVRRLAKKYRNPENETNQVESEIYKTYILAYIEKRPMYDALHRDSEGHPVYYRPIKVDALCLSCHGKVGEQIPKDLANKIAELYPDDKAIDFLQGQPRGMWAITFNDYIVNDD